MTRGVNAEAGSYIEDDPVAWEAFVGAFRKYADYVPGLRDQFGRDAYEIAAGSALSYLADQHGVFIRREPTLAGDMPDSLTVNGHLFVHVAGCPCPRIQALVARLADEALGATPDPRPETDPS